MEHLDLKNMSTALTPFQTATNFGSFVRKPSEKNNNKEEDDIDFDLLWKGITNFELFARQLSSIEPW